MSSPENLKNENEHPPKQRHGCVTAWLVLLIIANSATAMIYFFASEMIIENLANVSLTITVLLGIFSIANVVFAIMLFQWKKLGFWGFLGTSIVALIINMSVGLGIGQSLIGLLGAVILYGILQIKNDGVKAWENLESPATP